MTRHRQTGVRAGSFAEPRRGPAAAAEPGKARCRFHGGKSTGPKTQAGRARIAETQRLRVALMDYLVAIAVSIPLAVALVNSRFLSRTLYPILVIVQSTPIVAVAPIIVVALGASDLPRVVITFLIAFFPIVVSTVTGLSATPEELIELSRSLRAGRTREMLHIRLPFAVPYIFSALKISITLAIIGAVVAEFVAAERGLGFSSCSRRRSSRFRRPSPAWRFWLR